MATRKLNRSGNVSGNTTEEPKVIPIEPVSTECKDPTYTFDFLAGYTDKDGVTHTDFELREMTGRDEEAISKGDIKGNICRAVSVMLSRTCVRIGTLTPKSVGIKEWENIIKSLYVGDQDYMVMKLREISFGDEVTIEHQCPSCKRKLSTTFGIDELEIIPFDGVRKIDFTLSRGYTDRKGVTHKEGSMRLATGLDREITIPIAKNNVAKGETALLTRLCSFNDGYTIDGDVMANLTMRDRRYLQDLLKEHLFGIKSSINITCPDCGTDFEGSLNLTNFI